MGVGVWAMHFVGMLAFRLPVKVTYDPLTTALSIAPAILASAVVLTIISQQQIKARQLLLGAEKQVQVWELLAGSPGK
mgnify:CR=1 FL=1